ncbi:hypothetical protein P12x_000927 [Tundrisphaera lichenicola]|uniref:hypothetical protein n=1 Tax=Tundrisphaera lichenicola TaxID=2029860 RepID=UPI003EC089CD
MESFAEATVDDLAEVAAAGQAYRLHWDSFRAMPERGATFAGSSADIAALDYLDYEQLGHPAGGLGAAALVWGNVLVAQAGLQWCRGVGGDLWLGAEVMGVQRAVLWPLARLAEAKSRESPQFGQFVALLLYVIEELVSRLDLPTVTHARLRRLQAVLEVGEHAVADGEPGAAVGPP